MPDESYLTELHASFGLPEATVVDLVKRATGEPVASMERLVQGDENEVYRVPLTSGRVVYPRVRRPGWGGFHGEIWAMGQARAVGVPTPEVLLFDNVESGGQSRHAMVLAEAPGCALADALPDLPASAQRAVMVDLGRVLARLHTVATPGPGVPSHDLSYTDTRFEDPAVWPEPDQWRAEFIAARTAEAKKLGPAGLTSAEIDRIIALLGSSPHTPVRAKPVLCHGDIHPENVFVDDKLRISALIDWGLWQGGSALGELASIAAGHADDDFAAIVDGHGGWPADDPEFRHAIAVSIAAQSVTHLAWNLSIGATDRVEYGVGVLRTALATA